MMIALLRGWPALVLIGFSAYLIWHFFFRREPGFKEWVKDPSLFDKFTGQTEEHQARIAAAEHWSEGKLKKNFERYLWKSKAQFNDLELDVLKSQIHRIQPLAIAVLADPALHGKLTTPTKEMYLRRFPLERACKFLVGPAADAAVPLLIPFLSHTDKDVRVTAAATLGHIGTRAATAPLRTALRDPEDRVRTWTLLGLRRPALDKTPAPECLPDLFNDLQQLVLQGQNVSAAAELMMLVEPAATRAVLLRDEALRADSPHLSANLGVLLVHSLPPPREKLLTIIETLERGPLKHPTDSALADALQLLGLHRHPDDSEFLQFRITHANSTVAQGAAAAMVGWVGLAGLIDRLWADAHEREQQNLPIAHRRLLAVLMLDAEVNNGGFDQYFFNSSGDFWRDAQVGLDQMGFTERATLLREATAHFGTEGPDENHELRQEQLSRLARADDGVFSPLDDRYYASKENVAILTSNFTWKNPELFRAPATG